MIISILAVIAGSSAAVCADDDLPSDSDGATKFTDSNGYLEYSTTIRVEADRPDDPHVINELPAFVTVIRLDPDMPSFKTLPELLSGAVGVTIKDFGGLGKLSTVSIRGSSANQVMVLLDGIPINTASDSGVDLSSLSLENIESVEILRGADSAVYGSGAIGGVVNLVSRKDRKPGWTIDGSTTYGSFGTMNVSVGTWAQRDPGRLRVSARYQRTDGDFTFLNDNGTAFNPDDDYDDTRLNNSLESFDGSIWFRTEPFRDAMLSGSLEGFVADKGIPGLTTFPSEHATQSDRRLTGHARLEQNLSSDDFKRLHLEVQGKYVGMDFSDPEGEQTGVPLETSQRTRSIGVGTGYDFDHRFGTGGFAVSYNREQLADRVFDDPLRESAAVSGRHDLGMFDDSLWMTTLLRFDSISDADSHWSPKIGVRLFLTNRFSIKTNTGYGFRAPSFNELYLEAGYITGNPDLLPEEAVSYDAGFAYESPRCRIEAAWFRIDSDDLIQYQLVSGFRYKPFNIGRAQSEGIELDGSVNLGPGLTLSGSWTWDRAVDRSDEPNVDGKQIPGRPEHDLFGKIAWNHHAVGLWAELHYLSGNFVTRANTKELDGRMTGNAGASWEVTKSVQAGLEVKNLNDDHVVDVRGFPLPPRSWFATLRVTI